VKFTKPKMTERNPCGMKREKIGFLKKMHWYSTTSVVAKVVE